MQRSGNGTNTGGEKTGTPSESAGKRGRVAAILLAGLLVTSVLSTATVGAIATGDRAVSTVGTAETVQSASTESADGGASASGDATTAECEADQFTASIDEPNPLSIQGEVSADNASDRCAGKRVEFAYVEELVIEFEESTGSAQPGDDLDLFVTLDGRQANPGSYDYRLLNDDPNDVETLVLTKEELPLRGELGLAVRAYSGKEEFDLNMEYDMMSPRAMFSYTSLKDGGEVRPDERVRLDGSNSIVPNATVMPGNGTYEWTIRQDGSVVDRLTGQRPITQFEPGTYDVQLTVTGPNGASATTNQTITVDGQPVPDIVPEATLHDSDGNPHYIREEGLTLYGGNSVCNEGSITGYRWEFPNGSTGTGEGTPYEFEKPEGTKTVGLTVECTVYDYLDAGGDTIDNSTTMEVEVKMPPIKIYKVEQTTPNFALNAFFDAFGCDNLGNVNTYIVGEQDVANVTYSIGGNTIGGDRESSDPVKYEADTARLMPGSVSLNKDERRRGTSPAGSGSHSDSTVTIRAIGAGGATDEVTFKAERAPVPELLEVGLSPRDPSRIGSPSDDDEVAQCGAKVFIELVGDFGGSDDGSSYSPGNFIPSRLRMDEREMRRSYSSGDAGDGPGVDMNIGPLLPGDLAASIPAVKHITVSVGARFKYVASAPNADFGQIGIGGLLVGEMKTAQGLETQFEIFGGTYFLFNVQENHVLDFTRFEATAGITGRMDITSYFTGPLPISIDPPVVGSITIDPPLEVWFATGADVRLTRGADSNPGAMFGLDDLEIEMRGSPAMRLVAEIGYGSDDLPCGSCALELSLGGGLHSSWIEVQPDPFQGTDRVFVTTNMDVEACWHICLTWSKSWRIEELTLTIGRLRPSGATPSTGRAAALPPVGGTTLTRTDSSGPTLDTDVRSDTSAAAAMLGTETADADRSSLEPGVGDALQAV